MPCLFIRTPVSAANGLYPAFRARLSRKHGHLPGSGSHVEHRHFAELRKPVIAADDAHRAVPGAVLERSAEGKQLLPVGRKHIRPELPRVLVSPAAEAVEIGLIALLGGGTQGLRSADGGDYEPRHILAALNEFLNESSRQGIDPSAVRQECKALSIRFCDDIRALRPGQSGG